MSLSVFLSNLIWNHSVVVNYAKDNGETCQSDPMSVDIEVTGIGENTAKTSLFPNPAARSFTIEGKIKEVGVYDILGQCVHVGFDNMVDVSSWPDGLYFVRIVDENDAVTTVKLLKQN